MLSTPDLHCLTADALALGAKPEALHLATKDQELQSVDPQAEMQAPRML